MTEWAADSAAKFLREAAAYFERRSTGGEDSAFWANYSNAKNCLEIADLIEDQDRRITGVTRLSEDHYRAWNERLKDMLAALQLVANDVRSGSLPTDIQNAIIAAIAKATDVR